jgi:hypothetical protein
MKDKYKIIFLVLAGVATFLFIYNTTFDDEAQQSQIELVQSNNEPKEVNKINNKTNNLNVKNKTTSKKRIIKEYLTRYPFIHSCKNSYSVWSSKRKTNNSKSFKIGGEFDYKRLGNSKKYHSLRITRAVSVYFPVDKFAHFRAELKWLYRSWVYMLSYEPLKWRTDLVVFINYSQAVLNSETYSFFNDLNCTIKNQRTSDLEPPRCVLVDYVPLKSRKIRPVKDENKSIEYNHNYFLTKVDIFSNNSDDFIPYFNYLIENTKTYANLDSVLIAFDGYDYFSKAKYDFVMRTGN